MSTIDLDTREIDGACHCRSVRFHVRLADGFHTVRRCNCSICRIRGAVSVTVNVGDLEILVGEEALTLYQFNTNVARHYFCSKCGSFTHHQRRSRPNEFGVNVACLVGVSPFDFAEVPVSDGAGRHPNETSQTPGQFSYAGVLLYKPNQQ
jgi:hypothetical protein